MVEPIRRVMRLICAAGLIAVSSVGNVYATVIDFAGESRFVQIAGEFIDVAGFRFTLEEPRSTFGFIQITNANNSRDPGGLFLEGLFNANDGRFAMSAVDGSLFNLLSFDFSRRNFDTSDTRSAERIQIIGTLGGGGTVVFDTLDLLDAYLTAILPGSFVGLSSVLFDPIQNTNGLAFSYEFFVDNISVVTTTVPEPSTLGLLCVGILGLGIMRRKRVP